jgi:hypothetical protein
MIELGTESKIVHKLIIAAALSSIALSFARPAEAKLIWLKCGKQEISLDSDRERFSLISSGKIYQGNAVFSPGQIDFEFQFADFGNGAVLKQAYAIDRKSLSYIATSLYRLAMPGYRDTGWKASETEGNPAVGKCSIMKTPPTTGNQI